MSDVEIKRFFVKLAWTQVLIFITIALVATWFRGLGSEVILGWVLLVLLSALMLCVAYGIRRIFLGAAAIVVALVLVGASLLHNETWRIEQSDLLDWTVGAVAFAVGMFAWDARTNDTNPMVAHAAGATAVVALLAYAALAALYGPSVVTSIKGIAGLAAIGALVDLGGDRWKIPASIAAVVAFGSLLAKFLAENPT